MARRWRRPARDTDRFLRTPKQKPRSANDWGWGGPTLAEAWKWKKRHRAPTLPKSRMLPAFPGIPETPLPSPLQGLDQAGIVAARQRAQEYAQQYRTSATTSSGLVNSLLRWRDAENYAKRDNISPSEAVQRIRSAGDLTSQLKEQYRADGLYAGNASRKYDPLLEVAGRLERSTSPEEMDAAVGDYTAIAERQAAQRHRAAIKRAETAKGYLLEVEEGNKTASRLTLVANRKTTDPTTRKYLQEVIVMLRDPEAVAKNPEAILQAHGVVKALDEANEAAKPKGLGKLVARASKALSPLAVPMEELIMQPYYASKYAQEQGGHSLGRQLFSGLSAFPGMGFLAGGASARDRAATDSREERQALADAGELWSFGQYVTRQEDGGNWSGFADALFQVVADPLNVATFGTARLAKPGQLLLDDAARAVAREGGAGLLRTSLSKTDDVIDLAVKRASHGVPTGALPDLRRAVAADIGERAANARLAFLADTRRGQNLIEAAGKVLDRTFDAASIKKAIPGLDQRVAQEMADASSRADALDVFRRAFASGEYNPSISLRRQVLGGKAISAPGGVGLGRAVVRDHEGLFGVIAGSRKAVRGSAIRATTGVSPNAGVLAYNTMRAGLARAGTRLEDAYATVAPSVLGLAPEDRLARIWEKVEGNAALENLFEQNLKVAEKTAYGSIPTGLTGQAALDAALSSPTMEGFLKQMEVIAALGDGSLGDAAKAQVTAEAKFGFKHKSNKTGRLLTDAITGTAAPAPKVAGGLGRPQTVRFLESTVLTAANNGTISQRAANALLDEISRTAALKSNKFKSLEQRIVAAVSDSAVADEFDRLLANRDELVGAVENALEPVGLMRRAVNAPLRLVNSLTEPVSPAHVAFLGYTNDAWAVAARVEDVDRWVRDLGLDEFTRKMIGDTVSRVKSEDDLFKVVNNVLRTMAAREGLPADLLVAIQTNGVREVKQGSNKMTFARMADGLVKTDESVYTLAQRGEVVYLPDPDDVRRTVRDFKAQQGDLGAKFRVGLAAVPDLKLFGIHGPVTGDVLTIRNFLIKGHRKWKYLTVIPGVELAALGATVGFVATDGDTGDKLKGAAQASTIGLLTPLRYLTRVAGIEEGLRKYLAGGLNAEQWKPHLARSATQWGLDRPFTLHNAVKAGDPLGTAMSRRLATAEGEFGELFAKNGPIARIFRKDARYLDGYGRIINQQIHPETDALAETLLRRQAGEITDAEAVALFDQFILTDAGKLWLRRLEGGLNGPKNAAEAFARYDDFIRTYVPDADVARARLDTARQFASTGKKTDVARDVIKAAQRRPGALPDVIHAERTFTVPKNFKEVSKLRDRITRYIFEVPTTRLNRVPMAQSIYRDEYRRLLQNGMGEKRAQEIAEQLAVERTNRIMFRINDESRFAAKADYIFPFQQPREELLRVWAPLIANNPARAMHMTRLAAVAFNTGKDKGMFTQDRYGEWRMTVPGSAWLSKTLFNSGSAFDFRLQDLVFFGQGAYGVNIIPSPGGPYWGVGARLLINRNPEWFEGLSNAEREWLFPYGASGRIFRPEVSRMWQAWTGDIAPFEFGSKQEQENALNKHRIEVYLQLIWQHGNKTGDWSYRPSDDEWDSAVSASLKAWAFTGAFFPAGPALLRPDQKAVDALKQQYIVNGEFDYIAFVNDHPKFAPWMVGMSETVDDSFDAWARTQEDRIDDTLLHRRTTKDARRWAAELKEREAESRAYKELGDIQQWPAHMQSDKYAAWDEKYPDLAANQLDNYQRDIELMHIEGTLDGAAKEDALNRWRKRYGVTFPNYQRLASELHKGVLRNEFNPWDLARGTEEVVAEVERRLKRTVYAGTNFDAQFAAEQAEVSKLPVAEQIRYWDWRLNNFNYDWTDDPQLIMDRYYLVKQQRSALWQTAPMKLQRAFSDKKPLPYNEAMEAVEDDWREQISSAYSEAARLDGIIKGMAAKGQWGANYNALKAKRTAMYDLAKALKDKWFEGLPDVMGIMDDVRAVMVFASQGNTDAVREIQKYRKEHGWFMHSDEQASYLAMPAPVQDAFVKNLVDSLDIPPGEFKEGKKFWQWLTEFQQDLLERNMPAEKIEQWSGETPDSGGGKGGYGKRRGYYNHRYYGGGSEGADELSYAYAMFEKYNQRKGAKPPPAYKEYLALPNDAALRSAFLKLHPEVGDYIKLGPMANMPPVLAMMVADIMIRYGKWEGESRSMTEISEIGFAREMMARWNRRGDRKAPEAMQAWLVMPTGADKAQYLRDHPEIGEWMQLGPMANMPEAYREVVRDIMFRYQLWTDDQDPLGKVISGYFSTPSYARDQYLIDHPEVAEYWKVTRSVEQKAQYALADTYFSIKDPLAQRAFLAMHPELQEWFLNRRQKRYEDFLNRVAIYMGSNPEMFTAYLERQEQVLSDLLHKFSSAPIMRERYVQRDISRVRNRRAA